MCLFGSNSISIGVFIFEFGIVADGWMIEFQVVQWTSHTQFGKTESVSCPLKFHFSFHSVTRWTIVSILHGSIIKSIKRDFLFVDQTFHRFGLARQLNGKLSSVLTSEMWFSVKYNEDVTNGLSVWKPFVSFYSHIKPLTQGTVRISTSLSNDNNFPSAAKWILEK